MSQAQIDAFVAIEEALTPARRRVFDVIQGRSRLEWPAQQRGITLREIAGALGLPDHHVSGRITELRGLGLVQDSGRRRHNHTVWIADDEVPMFVKVGISRKRSRSVAHVKAASTNHGGPGAFITLQLEPGMDERFLRVGARLVLELLP